jgi:uncharacterized SAM-binding protein YcdF (DUF218 family)
MTSLRFPTKAGEHFVTALLKPIIILSFLTLLSMVHMWWRHKECRRRLLLILVPFLLLVVISTPLVAFFSLASLEWRYPPSDDIPPDAPVIVVLAGSILSADSVRARPELGSTTLYRCLHASELHRANPDRLILLSGGSFEGDGSPVVARVMRDFMMNQGVKSSQLLLEERSRNTYENAAESYTLLRERGVQRIVLVTDASHMPRASACFRKQGFEVIPSPCNYHANDYSFDLRDLLPDGNSAAHTEMAWHEWLGMAVYRIRGYL